MINNLALSQAKAKINNNLMKPIRRAKPPNKIARRRILIWMARTTQGDRIEQTKNGKNLSTDTHLQRGKLSMTLPRWFMIRSSCWWWTRILDIHTQNTIRRITLWSRNLLLMLILHMIEKLAMTFKISITRIRHQIESQNTNLRNKPKTGSIQNNGLTQATHLARLTEETARKSNQVKIVEEWVLEEWRIEGEKVLDQKGKASQAIGKA